MFLLPAVSPAFGSTCSTLHDKMQTLGAEKVLTAADSDPMDI